MDSRKGHYEILGVEASAPASQIERAYRFVMQIYGDEALGGQLASRPDELVLARRRIEEAYRVLKDPDLRRAYDAELSRQVDEDHAASHGRLPADPPPEAPKPRPAHLRTDIPPPEPPICGRSLREYREAVGASLQDIATETKIGVRYLESIESDRFDAFPAILYLKSYLQAYCAFLGLDARLVVDSYTSRLTA